MIVWHGTNISNISCFYDFSHFGTFSSAYDRSKSFDDKFMYRCEIDTSNLLEIKDYGNEMMLFDKDLYDQNLITQEQHYSLKILYYKDRIKWYSIMKSIFHNIDGFRYINVAENPGDMSYIIKNGTTVCIKEILTRKEACDKYPTLLKF